MSRLSLIVIGTVVLLIGLMLYTASIELGEHRRLVAQCIEDGKKEYECEALLRKPQADTVVIPVYQ